MSAAQLYDWAMNTMSLAYSYRDEVYEDDDTDLIQASFENAREDVHVIVMGGGSCIPEGEHATVAHTIDMMKLNVRQDFIQEVLRRALEVCNTELR